MANVTTMGAHIADDQMQITRRVGILPCSDGKNTMAAGGLVTRTGASTSSATTHPWGPSRIGL